MAVNQKLENVEGLQLVQPRTDEWVRGQVVVHLGGVEATLAAGPQVWQPARQKTAAPARCPSTSTTAMLRAFCAAPCPLKSATCVRQKGVAQYDTTRRSTPEASAAPTAISSATEDLDGPGVPAQPAQARHRPPNRTPKARAESPAPGVGNHQHDPTRHAGTLGGRAAVITQSASAPGTVSSRARTPHKHRRPRYARQLARRTSYNCKGSRPHERRPMTTISASDPLQQQLIVSVVVMPKTATIAR